MKVCIVVNGFVDFDKVEHSFYVGEGEGSVLGIFELTMSTFSFLFVITQHIKKLVSRKFSGLLRIICEVSERNKICKNFSRTGRDRAMFRVHFVKMV